MHRLLKKSWVRKFFLLPKLQQAGLSVATAAATAAAMYAIYPVTLVVVAMAVLCGHEVGHYLAAINLGVDAALPLFLPVFFTGIGMTVVRKSEGWRRSFIGMAGPLSGLAVVVAVAVVGWWTQAALLVEFAALAAIFELYAATIGSDGRMLRRQHRDLRLRLQHRRNPQALVDQAQPRDGDQAQPTPA